MLYGYKDKLVYDPSKSDRQKLGPGLIRFCYRPPGWDGSVDNECRLLKEFPPKLMHQVENSAKQGDNEKHAAQ